MSRWQCDSEQAVVGEQFFWRLGREDVQDGTPIRLRPFITIHNDMYVVSGIIEYVHVHYIAYIHAHGRWVMYDDSVRQVLRSLPARLEKSVHTLLVQRVSAMPATNIPAELWQNFIDMAKRFKLVGFHPQHDSADLMYGQMQAALPHRSEETHRQILTCLKSFCLADFPWHSAVFRRRYQDNLPDIAKGDVLLPHYDGDVPLDGELAGVGRRQHASERAATLRNVRRQCLEGKPGAARRHGVRVRNVVDIRKARNRQVGGWDRQLAGALLLERGPPEASSPRAKTTWGGKSPSTIQQWGQTPLGRLQRLGGYTLSEPLRIPVVMST